MGSFGIVAAFFLCDGEKQMCFFERLVEPFVFGELGFDTIVFAQDRLCRFRTLPEVSAAGLLEQFSRARG